MPRTQSTIEGVIFDLDGLMINSEDFFADAWTRFLAPFGGKLTQEEYNRDLIGRDHEGEVRYIIEKNNLDLPFETVSNSFWDFLLEEIRERGKPMAGLNPLLEDLATRGFALGVASNSYGHYVRKTLQILGVGEYFGDCVAAADEVQNPKPAPDLYLRVARCLDLSPEVCLALEDSPSGVKSAQAAGMRCVFIPNHNLQESDIRRVEADALFPSLAACHAALDDVLALAPPPGASS